MGAEEADWMAYIDTEVRAHCEAKGWRHQIRRKWSIRDKPVSGLEFRWFGLVPATTQSAPSSAITLADEAVNRYEERAELPEIPCVDRPRATADRWEGGS
jgi:hypothetical protein